MWPFIWAPKIMDPLPNGCRALNIVCAYFHGAAIFSPVLYIAPKCLQTAGPILSIGQFEDDLQPPVFIGGITIISLFSSREKTTESERESERERERESERDIRFNGAYGSARVTIALPVVPIVNIAATV